MRHVQVATACAATRLTAVVEPDASRRAALAAEGLPMVASLDAVPAETRAAIIATPTQDHAASAAACLSRGMAVLVEKPIAASLGEARAMAAQAEAAGLPLVIGHHRRCHPFSLSAREALAALGDPVAVQGFWSLRKPDAYFAPEWRRSPGAGPLMTNLSHEIDLLRFLLGEITEVSALTSAARRGLPIEDTAALALRFANGALGSFVISDAGASPWSFESGSGENPAIPASGADYLRVSATRGALAFPSLRQWRPADDSAAAADWSRALHPMPGPDLPRVDPLAAQLSRFAALVGGAEDHVLCRAQDGLAALRLTLAAALSGQRGTTLTPGDVPDSYTGV